MFSIIISEKGGAERRETFDKNEINVGRVQGNDLMLPKGNVSKHHARLLYRDGRFIVTDLKSTNGTYVNGRKIAQATIVREGDKIYIGDFVLRLDAGSGSGADVAASNDDESVRTLARNQPNAPAQQPVPPAPPPPAMASPQQAPRMMGSGGGAGNAAIAERDREDSDIPPPPKAPQAQPAPRAAAAAPPPAANPRGQTLALQGGQAQPQPRQTAQVPQRSPSVVAPAPAPVAAPAPAPAGAVTSPAAQAQLVAPPMVLQAAAPRVAPRETAAQAGRRLALITLVDRIADALDLAALRESPTVDDALARSIERVAREQAEAMREEGEAPEGTDLGSLAADAHRELTALGPIAALLEDDEVTEIQCARNDQVLAVRENTLVHADAAFTSDEALGRIIARLAQQAGDAVKPGETVIERRLPRGAHMIAVAPPTSLAHALIIRKRRKVDATLEDLVRANAMSRPMAVFLDACVQARANILASAPAGTSTALLVAALASAAPAGERVALLSDVEEVQMPQAHVVGLSLADARPRASEEAVRAAARLRPDRLILASIPAGATAALIEAIGEGAEGVVAAGAAPSLRQLLARFASQLAMARPGLELEAARECIAEAFDIAIELTTLADGRARILRISEVAGYEGKGPRDLLVFTPDASGADGTHQSTGAQPRAIAEFAARGIKLDPALFKRAR